MRITTKINNIFLESPKTSRHPDPKWTNVTPGSFITTTTGHGNRFYFFIKNIDFDMGVFVSYFCIAIYEIKKDGSFESSHIIKDTAYAMSVNDLLSIVN